MIKSQLDTIHIVNKGIVLYGNYLVVMEIDVYSFNRYPCGYVGETVVCVGICKISRHETGTMPTETAGISSMALQKETTAVLCEIFEHLIFCWAFGSEQVE